MDQNRNESFRQEYPSTVAEAQKAIDRDVSNIDAIVAGNEELISALEKQVEVLSNRLEPVSARYPEGDKAETESGLRGESSLAQKLAKETYRLRNLSDRISRMTRELEI